MAVEHLPPSPWSNFSLNYRWISRGPVGSSSKVITLTIFKFLRRVVQNRSQSFLLIYVLFHFFVAWRPRSPYIRWTWKRSFISTVRPTVRTNPSRKRSFSKMLFKLKEFDDAGFRFRVTGKHFGNGAFLENDDVSLRQTCDFFQLIINTNPKWWAIFGFFNSSSVVWTENIWCVFSVKVPFFKFLRRNVDGASTVFSVTKAFFITSFVDYTVDHKETIYRDVDRVLFADLFPGVLKHSLYM